MHENEDEQFYLAYIRDTQPVFDAEGQKISSGCPIGCVVAWPDGNYVGWSVLHPEDLKRLKLKGLSTKTMCYNVAMSRSTRFEIIWDSAKIREHKLGFYVVDFFVIDHQEKLIDDVVRPIEVRKRFTLHENVFNLMKEASRKINDTGNRTAIASSDSK